MNSFVWNQVTSNYPISGFGPGYKLNPMQVVQQTATGGFSNSLTIQGTNTNTNSGNFDGFVLDAVTNLVVATAGTYTFYVNYANVSSFAVYIGGGATFSSQNYNGGNSGNPFPGTSPKNGYPLAIVSTNMSATSHPNTVSSYITFSAPGIYPIEVVYNQYLSVQPSYDNNGFFQITYIAGAQNQNVGQGVTGVGFQSHPVAITAAPPTGAVPTGALRLTPTGGTAGLKIQGTTDTLTLTVQNVVYHSVPYVPILEGTPGSLFVYNAGAAFDFQTYNGFAVNTIAAANSVFSVTGSNTGGLFNATPQGTHFLLNYNGGAFSFITPGSQISTTDLTLTADDVAWYEGQAGPNFNSFDLFTPVGGTGGISYSVAVDFMTKPTIKSVSPSTLQADGKNQALQINLSKPMSPQQQGLYGTGDTVNITASLSGGATFQAPFSAVLDAAGYLQGWYTLVLIPINSNNGSITLTVNVFGTLTYLSGTTFVTSTVNYITASNTVIPTQGDQFVNPVPVSLTMTPAQSPLVGVQTLTGTAYTFDNNPMTMSFFYKHLTLGTTTQIGAGSLINSYTSTVGGKTVYNKVFRVTYTFPTVIGTGTAGNINIGFLATDTVSGLFYSYQSTTTYYQPVTGGGGGGGGGGGCFTLNVPIETPAGFVKFGALPRGEEFEIVNETGTHRAVLVVHEYNADWMVDLGDGKLVTVGHNMKTATGDWVRAEDYYTNLPKVWFEGTVYNLHILSDKPEDHHYILWNGDVAHNVIKA